MHYQIGRPEDADICALEFYVMSIYRRLNDVETTRIKVSEAYSQFSMGTKFDQKLKRVLSELEEEREPKGFSPP